MINKKTLIAATVATVFAANAMGMESQPDTGRAAKRMKMTNRQPLLPNPETEDTKRNGLLPLSEARPLRSNVYNGNVYDWLSTCVAQCYYWSSLYNWILYGDRTLPLLPLSEAKPLSQDEDKNASEDSEGPAGSDDPEEL